MKPRTKARLLGLAVSIAGIVNVVSAITPSLSSRLSTLRELLTPLSSEIAAGATALLGIGLLLLGRGISQRKRVAYQAALAILILSTATHVGKGLDVEEAALTAALAFTLFFQRAIFVAGPGPARWRTLAHVIPYVLVLDFGYGMGALFLRRNVVFPHLTFTRALNEVASRLIGITGPLTYRGPFFARWFPRSLTAVGALSMAYLLLMILAPVAERAGGRRDEREDIAAMIDRPDGDTLDPFALRRDKRYAFSPDRRAAVAYRYLNGVGLASGDPVGEPTAFPGALRAFVDVCEQSGWRPAVYGARFDRLALYENLGLKSIYIGDEAIIDVPSFGLEGRRMRNVRQSVAHSARAGVTTEVHREGTLDPTLRRALIGISDRHKAGAPERGFSMALDGLLSGRDPDTVLIVCRDAQGAPIAFQRYVPCRAGKGLSLDAMRRDTGVPGGVNERMIVDIVEWGRANGVSVVSLNFAAFRNMLERDADITKLQALSAWIIKKMPSYIQIDTLRRFNKKFRPRWVPRYAIYRSAIDIAAIGIAALNAEAMLPFQKRGDVEEAPEPQPVG
ncbi:MAG: bifunctional lysylphosphatidylglycerol flippase/synthetase MprF [Actinomycetota bacterium]